MTSRTVAFWIGFAYAIWWPCMLPEILTPIRWAITSYFFTEIFPGIAVVAIFACGAGGLSGMSKS